MVLENINLDQKNTRVILALILLVLIAVVFYWLYVRKVNANNDFIAEEIQNMENSNIPLEIYDENANESVIENEPVVMENEPVVMEPANMGYDTAINVPPKPGAVLDDMMYDPYDSKYEGMCPYGTVGPFNSLTNMHFPAPIEGMSLKPKFTYNSDAIRATNTRMLEASNLEHSLSDARVQRYHGGHTDYCAPYHTQHLRKSYTNSAGVGDCANYRTPDTLTTLR